MHTNISADVSATLNRDDIIRLLEDGELSAEGLELRMAEPEAAKLLKEIDRNP